MKKTIVTLILLLLVGNIFAQEDEVIMPKIGFGLKAGLNSMHNKTVNESSDNVQKKSGVYIGAFVNIPTSDVFSIQPEIIYSSTEFQGRNNVNILHIPVLLNFELGNGFSGFLGHASEGHYNWQVLIFGTIAVIIGAQLGGKMMKEKMKAQRIKQMFGILLILVAIKFSWNIFF